MIGGHLPFAGIEDKVRYHDTPIETVLLVTINLHLDRAKRPKSVHPPVVQPGHRVLVDVPEGWPTLLVYNSLTSCHADPFLVAGSHGVGHRAAFVSDYAPRWRPLDFMGWPGCNRS